MQKGSLRKVGNTWYLRYRINGNMQEKSLGQINKTEAEKIRQDFMYKLNHGYANIDNTKVKDYLLDIWLPDYIKGEKSEGTYNRYRDVCNLHIIPCIGNIALSELKVVHIEKYLKELKRKEIVKKHHKDPALDVKVKLSPTTIQNCYIVLNNALNRAVKLQMINDNPCRFVDTPKRAKFKPDILTLDEFKLIYNSLNKGDYNDYIMKLALNLTCELGLRRGEMCGLTYDDFDFKNNKVTIQRALKRNADIKGYEIGDLKTDGSYRELPISSELAEMILDSKRMKKLNKLKYGPYYTDSNKFNGIVYGFVFTNEDGSYIVPERFLQRIKRLCSYCGINKNIRWHDLRHTNATLLLQGNTDMKTVQERLGHSMMQTTADIYAHVTEEMNREATSTIENMLYKNS